MLVLGGLAVVALLGIGGAVWWNHARTTESGGVPPGGGTGGGPTEVTGTPPPEEVLATVGQPVSVEVSGEPAQWVRLMSGEVTAADGRGALTANVPEGDYELAIKIVGRGAVRAPLTVSPGGLVLKCEPDSRANLRCAGGKKAITLKP